MTRQPILSFATPHTVVNLLDVGNKYEIVSSHRDGWSYKVLSSNKIRAFELYFDVLDLEIF
jgi:hypothetical protein